MVVSSAYRLVKKQSTEMEYPRPQFKRGYWYDLNGEWEFTFDDRDIGEQNGWPNSPEKLSQNIQVPYAYQSKMSGIHLNENHEIVWYKRNFYWDKPMEKDLLLHFEAVDYYTKVWVNGQFIGEHTGGHTPFSFSIGSAVQHGDNSIVIRVEDRNSVEQPIGKQSWKSSNFLCWYTRTTGIWQPVWLEEVSPLHIKHVKMTPNIEQSTLQLETWLPHHQSEAYVEAHVYFQGEWINTVGAAVKKDQTRVEMTVDVESDQADFRVFYWSPDSPQLYDISFVLRGEDEVMDEVDSYFGMRSIEVTDDKILLNRETFYQKLILDQGYYKDALMTADYEQMKNDLTKVKDMGFNGVRRHQTIADRRYIYLCDQLGLVMWAEMPSIFRFTDQSMNAMLQESREMVHKHINHPSVIVYTLMNESWGVNEIYHRKDQQSFINALYYQTKALDSSRLIVGNDGWEHTLTDILTIHDYNSNAEQLARSYENKEKYVNGSPSKTSRKQNYARGYRYGGEPIIMSEFGGIAFAPDLNQNDWGYGSRPQTKEDALIRFEKLMKAIMDTDSIQGFCYTQLSDVEQEVNGLLNHDHEEKFDTSQICKVLSAKKSDGFIFE
ncbi:beta galactosidase jelly roll domain-containing protein [Halobacillus sp. A1]|uniref:glycoside hydrolase family 2 protein n=1 Tax=Halobacillus sp. A1 TaxID=2880262 RepID=UPI0020A6D653|nr:sugar-binding domain-containing protein [Halobacillus sp. A1]MCP3031111.1 beta galactosidase jelly roll domain-containing protein [Halobacillus sp. A1]